MAAGERRTKELTSAAISFATGGTLALVAAVAGQTTRCHRLVLVAAAACTVQIARGATNLTGAMTLATGVPLIFEHSLEPHFVTAANEALNLVVVGVVQVSGMVEFIRSA